MQWRRQGADRETQFSSVYFRSRRTGKASADAATWRSFLSEQMDIYKQKEHRGWDSHQASLNQLCRMLCITKYITYQVGTLDELYYIAKKTIGPLKHCNCTYQILWPWCRKIHSGVKYQPELEPLEIKKTKENNKIYNSGQRYIKSVVKTNSEECTWFIKMYRWEKGTKTTLWKEKQFL